MKLYRVNRRTDGGTSGGFSFHSSMKDAKREAARYQREMEPDEELPEIDVIEFECSKGGVLRLLNYWACHANNG